ncbi:hypothetical protein SBA4_480011 [Candidatus Sulfopaludibacter sp. SbA4]|nr:hypothetical protein SBA4_480011 [Candidatus Sulfopaludibacter sp. SbA4]
MAPTTAAADPVLGVIIVSYLLPAKIGGPLTRETVAGSFLPGPERAGETSAA